MRGAGGARGRGARGRGRGGKTRGKKEKMQKSQDEEYVIEPMTEAEVAYQEGTESGWLTAYAPTLSKESLQRYGAATISSPRGIQENIVYKMQVATDTRSPEFLPADKHLANVYQGVGTLFENKETRKATEKYRVQRTLGRLTTEDKQEMMQQWVGGKYTAPRPTKEGDILAHVEAFTTRNETYLPEDRKKLENKLAQLLPAQMIQPKAGGTGKRSL
jgi:hypothetical protein